ncbi:electron transfer flavoprotein subunit beta/FixA family protein [Rhodocaloribacter sp.]
MNIAVCLKQTPDTETRVKIAGDGVSVLEDDVQWIINPYDEAAVEAALRLTEAHGGEVTVFSLGPPRVEKAIREALAMGAHRAVRLHADAVPADPRVTAKALATALRDGGFDLILAGQQAVDDDQAQTPQRIAQALDLACVTNVEELTVEGGRGTARRVLEGVQEVSTFSLPAVLGVNLRLNEPRYPSFKGIMQAKRKPIDVIEAELAEPKLVVERLSYPPEKAAGRVFEGVEAVPEVVRLLHEEAKVI